MYNNRTGYYEITEENITYHLTFEQSEALKQYFHDHRDRVLSPEGWYNSLTTDEKKRVSRTGILDNTEILMSIT